MLENEITEEDIGSWFEMRGPNARSRYVKITQVGTRSVDILYQDGDDGRRYNDGRLFHQETHRLDLIRKLDPIEVNLLRLEQRLKDVRK